MTVRFDSYEPGSLPHITSSQKIGYGSCPGVHSLISFLHDQSTTTHDNSINSTNGALTNSINDKNTAVAKHSEAHNKSWHLTATTPKEPSQNIVTCTIRRWHRTAIKDKGINAVAVSDASRPMRRWHRTAIKTKTTSTLSQSATRHD